MNKKEIMAGSSKMGFNLGEDGNFHLPIDLLALPETEIFLNWINKRKKLLNNLSSNKTLFVDFRHNQTMISEEKNWSPQIPFDQLRLKPRSLETIAVITPSLHNETLDNFSQRLTKAVQYLHPHHGVIFIAEEKGEDSDQKTRKKVLKDAGLVKVSILKPKNQPFLFWEGRLAKEHPPENLTENKDFWSTLRIICKNYETTGYDVVITETGKPTSWQSLLEVCSTDQSLQSLIEQGYELPEIVSHCSQSKNPPDSVARLIDGSGLIIRKKYCGDCVWEIDLSGGQQKIADCGDPDCDKTASDYISPTYKYVVGEREISAFCFDCETPGTHLKQIVEIEKRYLWKSRISVTEYCPHHGETNRQTSWELKANIR